MKLRVVSSLIAAAMLSCSGEAKLLPKAEWAVIGGDRIPAHWHSIAVPLSGGRALLTGFNAKAFLYEPATGLRRVADVPGPLDSHFGAALLDDRALVGG